MMRVGVGLLAMGLALVARPAHAQISQEGLEISVDFLHIATRGNDVGIDGIAGARTQILIASRLGRDDTPRLSHPAAQQP